MEESIPLEKLWKSRNTILEILEDRGFEIPDSDKLTQEEFIDWAGNDDEKTIRNAMTLLYEKEDEEKILVYWPIEPSLGTNVKMIYKEMVEKNIKKSIIVINTKVTSQSNKFIRDIAKLNYILYIYTLAETQFNITKHRLVPQHIICTPSEKKKLLTDYSINTKQLPCIKSSDVMIRHLGAKKDQIIRIIRDSETQPGYKTISYRVVS
jgi:DNA-directed RNA polymerases I, II, and III subunit RPABC1